MHLSIRRHEGAAGRIEAIADRLLGLIPTLRGQPGFEACYWLASEQGDVVSVHIFDDRQAAEMADEATREWTAAHLPDLLPQSAEVLAGEVAHQAVGTRTGLGQPFILIRVVEGITAPVEVVGPIVQQHSLVAIRSSPGLHAAYILRDERNRGRAATVTLFDTREHATGAHEKAVSVMRQQLAMVAPEPPKVMALGQIVLMAFA
jgi:heme-degrading monooxygenase HmoA